MTRTRAKLELLALAFGLLLPGCAISGITPYEVEEGGISKPPRDDDASAPDRDAEVDPVDSDASTPDGDASVDAGTPPPEDAGSSTPDASTTPDSGVDAGTPDASTPDAGVDSGVPDKAPKIDGIIEAGEWTTATRLTQSEPTNWGVGKNQLSDLYAKIYDGRLYIALAGKVEAQNALVLYVDAQASVGSAPKDLKDDTGALDNAISAAITVPTTFKADFAFGTRVMGKWGAGLDDTMGWRDLREPANFAWIDTAKDAPSVCSLDACETSVALSTLAPSGSNMLLFARIVTAIGDAAANQTLPFDAPATPLTVSNVLTLKVGN